MCIDFVITLVQFLIALLRRFYDNDCIALGIEDVGDLLLLLVGTLLFIEPCELPLLQKVADHYSVDCNQRWNGQKLRISVFENI